MNGTDLHQLTVRDACLVAIAAVNRSVRDAEGKSTELARVRQWQNLAKSYGINAEEDPELVEERRQRALAAIAAEEGLGDD